MDVGNRFVVYLRLFQRSQAWRGRCVEAQKLAVAPYGVWPNRIVATLSEIESGGMRERPQLAAAIEAAAAHDAVLVIARLNRLIRNTSVIDALAESRVEFVACDLPHAGRHALPRYAEAAWREREAISLRTRAALAAAKARGVKLGNPDGRVARQLAAAAQQAAADHRAEAVAPVVQQLRDDGLSLRAIAAEMERRGINTMRRGRWSANKIVAILSRQSRTASGSG